MPDYGTPDIYRSPRYSPLVATSLSEAAMSSMWDDWDLNGLLLDIPHKFAAKLGAKHGIFCSTGTAGLYASLMSLPLKPGDEVIVPAMTFIRAVTPLLHLGLIPVLADIDPNTGNLAPEALKNLIGPKTRAVVVVHMWGIPADMSGIIQECKKHNIYLIEDFSHAHFSKHEQGFVGSFGHVAFASLQRKKTLSVGEGGLIVTSDSTIYERLQQITSPGSFKGTPNYNEFSGFGLNLRMSPFSAVVAKQLLIESDKIVQDRAAQSSAFDKILAGLPEHISAPAIPTYAKFVSPYGYKPVVTSRVTREHLVKANSFGLWRFGSFSYGHILQDVFWKKDSNYYPFSQMIQPKASEKYPGYEKYISGRVSLSVPTVEASYWSESMIDKWSQTLKQAFGA
ncbi:MAG: aminotransferase class V-fold PLP-dependent enzyme [Pseudomonadota bacterium]